MPKRTVFKIFQQKYLDEFIADSKENESQFPVKKISDEHKIIIYMIFSHLPKLSSNGPSHYYPCIHGKSMQVTQMEMIHMIAALPEFKGVHPKMILNFWKHTSCERKDGNDHYVKFKYRDNEPLHKISNAGHGLAPFCTNYHSRPIGIEVIRTVFDNVQVYCPIWQKKRGKYKDFNTRYKEAQLITKPDAFLADGIDPNTKCILTMSKKQRTKCGNKLKGRGACGGDLEFTISAHDGIHFTSMKCLQCQKPDSLYCKICDKGKLLLDCIAFMTHKNSLKEIFQRFQSRCPKRTLASRLFRGATQDNSNSMP